MRVAPWLLTLAAGCGGGAPSVGPAEVAALPSIRGDLIWADGSGPSRTEAVADARRAVSEQITAQLRSVVESDQAERGGRHTQTLRARVVTETAFEHAELIRIVGLVREGGGWAARAALKRSEAAEALRADQAADAKQLDTLRPILRQALRGLDASVLLASEQSPGVLLSRMARRQRILASLARGAPELQPTPALLALERKASAARRAARLRLKISGGASAPLRRAALDEVRRLLARRGCKLSGGGVGTPPPEGRLAAEVSIRVHTRDHREAGMRWRYLGLEVSVLDARSARPILQFSALPELVHGGGRTWAQADRAAARALRSKLAARGEARFSAITCR